MENITNDKLKALTVLLKSTQTVQDVLRKDIQQYDMNLTEFAVLELLYHKGEQPIQHIGKKILIASSSITYVVDKLEKKGFVRRKACPDDRRVTFAEITDKGKAFIEEIFPKHEDKVNVIFNPLTDEEVITFIDLLKKVGLHAKDL